MTAARDPKRYYYTLGVGHDASASAIKAAYRAKALQLHPDVNQSPGATEAFQALQEAYAVLSDPNLRAEYDADSAVPVDATQGGHSDEPLEPVTCSRCGLVTALPRLKVFYRVFGWIYGATRTPYQGVYCSSCEFKVGVTCSAVTMATGWWSAIGFVWTIATLFHNFVGGRFYFQDAQLRTHQAYYFAQQGKFKLAAAVARSALDSLDRAAPGAEKAGRTQASETLRSALRYLIGSLGEAGQTGTLKAEPELLNRRFAVQVSMLLALVGGITFYIASDIAASRAQESARLERAGLERAQAEAVARSQAAALEEFRQPLPPTGRMDTLGRPLREDQSAPFRVSNSASTNSVIRLVRVADGQVALSAFIRSGGTLELDAPLGDYIVRVASGQTWYGPEVRFGPSTRYTVLDSTFTFSIDGRTRSGNELELKAASGGNLKDSPIAASQF